MATGPATAQSQVRRCRSSSNRSGIPRQGHDARPRSVRETKGWESGGSGRVGSMSYPIATDDVAGVGLGIEAVDGMLVRSVASAVEAPAGSASGAPTVASALAEVAA